MTENLFSYGTLQSESVQLNTFGRRLEGIPDVLIEYKQGLIKIEDETVIVSSGMTHHPIISHTGNHEDFINGTLFLLTEAELNQADEYEAGDYKRISVKLNSGKNAWVYIDSNNGTVKYG